MKWMLWPWKTHKNFQSYTGSRTKPKVSDPFNNHVCMQLRFFFPDSVISGTTGTTIESVWVYFCLFGPRCQQVQLGLMQQREQRKERNIIAEAFLWMVLGMGSVREKKQYVSICPYGSNMTSWVSLQLYEFCSYNQGTKLLRSLPIDL